MGLDLRQVGQNYYCCSTFFHLEDVGKYLREVLVFEGEEDGCRIEGKKIRIVKGGRDLPAVFSSSSSIDKGPCLNSALG